MLKFVAKTFQQKIKDKKCSVLLYLALLHTHRVAIAGVTERKLGFLWLNDEWGACPSASS